MSDPPIPTDLIQIEEPSEDRGDRDPGLAIGFDITDGGLRAAIAVGGNAEWVQGSKPLFIEPGLSLSALSTADIVSPETLAFAAAFQTALSGLCRDVAARAQRLVTGAVAVVPPDLDRRALAVIMGSVEGAGLDLLGIIETPVALAYAAGIDRSAPGCYRIDVGDTAYAVWVEDGAIRFDPEPVDMATPANRIDPGSAALGAALLAETRNLGHF